MTSAAIGATSHPIPMVIDTEMSPDTRQFQEFADKVRSEELKQKQLHEQQQQQAAAAAAAARQTQDGPPGSGGFFKHKHSTPGLPDHASSAPFNFVDQYSSESLIRHLFMESLDRIRKSTERQLEEKNDQRIVEPKQIKLPPEEIIQLNSLFPKDFANALAIIDDNKIVTHVSTGAKRVYWSVSGSSSSSESYCTTQFHCNCMSFFNSVVINSEKIYCKHQLACLIGDALNMVSECESITDAVMGARLSQMAQLVGQKSFQRWGRG